MGRPEAAGVYTVFLLLAACQAAPLSPPPPTPTPPAAASPEVSPNPPPAIGPGQPYSPTDVLAKMAGARPAIPDAIQTLDVATALSRALWTFDGAPYDVWDIDGACGPRVCQISIGGAPSFLLPGTREDAWFFEVSRATRELAAAATDGRHELQGYPTELDPELDRLARSLVDPGKLEGLVYRNAIWWPPPRFGEFTLLYTSGLEEGSPRVSVTVNLPQRRLVTLKESVS